MRFDTMLNQKAVWWAQSSVNAYGAITYASPVEIDCRIQNRQEVQEVGVQDGTTMKVLVRAVVYHQQALNSNDMIYPGPEADLASNHDDPSLITEARRVLVEQSSVSVKADEILKTAWLV